jgi:FeS assembly SUF system protein
MTQIDKYKIEQKVIEKLKTVFDPEIPVNIYDLGLVYRVKVDTNAKINIEMTLTSPNCPVAEIIPLEVERKVMSIEGVSDVHVEIVWDPPWNYNMMSEGAKLQLGMV